MEPNRVLAFAAAHAGLALVFMVGREVKDWRISGFAARSPEAARAYVGKFIKALKPDVVITEAVHHAAKKNADTKALITAMASAAEDEPVLDIVIPRPRHFANKYDEAEALAERYPVLATWKPQRRRFFDNEPRNTVLFEALALADEIVSQQA